MASQLESLPPEVLDAVLRATQLSAPRAARLLPCVCRAFRASAARIAASHAPFATLVAVSCSEARALLLLRLRLLPPSATDDADAETLPAELLARYDVAHLGSEEENAQRRNADVAWPTYVARAGPRGAKDTPLLLSEYARSGLVRPWREPREPAGRDSPTAATLPPRQMVMRASVAPDGTAELTCDGVMAHQQVRSGHVTWTRLAIC